MFQVNYGELSAADLATATDIAYPMWLAVRLAGWPHYQKNSVNHVFPLDIVFPEALA